MIPSANETTGWQRLGPALQAALLVSPGVALLEIISSLLPAIGYAATLPVAILLYFFQGFLVGSLTQADPRYTGASALRCASLGLISGLWTSLVISNLVTIAITILLVPASVGAFLAAVPAVLAGSLIDVFINTLLSAFAAWLYARFGSRRALQFSCALAATVVILSCFALSGLSGGLIALGIKLLTKK